MTLRSPLYRGQKFGIRPFREQDTPALYEAVRESLKELIPWLHWAHPHYSIQESAHWVESRDLAWRRGEDYSFVIVDLATEGLVGGVGVNQIDVIHRLGNLGYWVRSSRTGRGAATEASRLAARFAFRELELHRLEIVMSVRNEASRRVAEKLGAVREGRLRERVLVGEQLEDAWLYSLLPTDLKD